MTLSQQLYHKFLQWYKCAENNNNDQNVFWSYVKIWINTLWCTLVQLLHYILKCIHLEWRWLFGPFRYMLIQTVWLNVLIISIPDEELFSETAVGCTASYFVKIIWCSCWFWTPPPILRLSIAYFAVAEGWLLLVIGWFVLFFFIQINNTKRKG